MRKWLLRGNEACVPDPGAGEAFRVFDPFWPYVAFSVVDPLSGGDVASVSEATWS
jgi:hypothetical protein